jgi:amylosucrase
MHRPPMDWDAAERRHDPGSVEGRIWAGLQRLVAARTTTRAVHAQGRSEPLWTSNPHVFALEREHAGERLLLLANFTPLEQAVRGFRATAEAALVDGRPLEARGDYLVLQPYQFLWIR